MRALPEYDNPHATMPDQSILLARQPIFDAALNVVAFELLHRVIGSDTSDISDADEASARVLLNAFGSTGINRITEGKPAFINFTTHLIINPPPLDPHHLIIEVLEDVKVTPQLLEALRDLRASGFRIALDDFQHHPSLEPLVELADIVKLDVLELGLPLLRAEVRQLRNYPVRLLAEKIETWEVFNHCVDLGFSYFQGFFLARPQLMHGKRLDVAMHAVLALLTQLASERSNAAILAETAARDPALSLDLIKLVNSAFYRRVTPIESLRDAIAYLGLDRTKSWCQLLVLSRVGGKPGELTRMAMARARFCELLAMRIDPRQAPRYFVLGVLSMLDAFLDIELGEALSQMQIGTEMRAALLAREGRMGMLLQIAVAFESAQWQAVSWESLAQQRVTQEQVEQDYLASLQWAQQSLVALSKPA